MINDVNVLISLLIGLLTLVIQISNVYIKSRNKSYRFDIRIEKRINEIWRFFFVIIMSFTLIIVYSGMLFYPIYLVYIGCIVYFLSWSTRIVFKLSEAHSDEWKTTKNYNRLYLSVATYSMSLFAWMLIVFAVVFCFLYPTIKYNQFAEKYDYVAVNYLEIHSVLNIDKWERKEFTNLESYHQSVEALDDEKTFTFNNSIDNYINYSDVQFYSMDRFYNETDSKIYNNYIYELYPWTLSTIVTGYLMAIIGFLFVGVLIYQYYGTLRRLLRDTNKTYQIWIKLDQAIVNDYERYVESDIVDLIFTKEQVKIIVFEDDELRISYYPKSAIKGYGEIIDITV